MKAARAKLLQAGVVDRVVHFMATHLTHRTICDFSYVLLLRLLKLETIARDVSPFTIREIFSIFVQWERMKKESLEIHIKLQHLMLFLIYMISCDTSTGKCGFHFDSYLQFLYLSLVYFYFFVLFLALIEQLVAGVEVVPILSSFLANTCSDKMALNLTHDIIGKLMRIGILFSLLLFRRIPFSC
jgi:hypothetical protein